MGQLSPRASQLRRQARRLALLLLVAAFALLTLHVAAGKQLMAAVYDGPLTPFLGDVLEGRNVHPVDHYQSVLNGRIAHLLASIVALALALVSCSFAAGRPTPLLFALDFLFIAIDRSFGVVDRRPLWFSITKDGGYPELFQYAKEAAVAVTFVLLYRRRHAAMYLVWSALFLYLLLDDAFMVHEELGALLSTRFEFPAVLRLRPADLGELLVSGSVGTLTIGLLATTYLRAPSVDRRTAHTLIALLGVLALFGVGVDMVAMAFDSRWIALLEDAGEMLTVSAILWYVDRELMETTR